MKRENPLEINKENFIKTGHELINKIAEFYETIGQRPVTKGENAGQLQKLLGQISLPLNGKPVEELINNTTELIFNHSLLNGHPKFLGYITGSPAQIGSLA